MISVIVVAGGSGKRMLSEIPKQFLELNGLPIIMHTLNKLNKSISTEKEFILVLPENQTDYWEGLCIQHQFNIPHTIAFGGNERFDSVKNGLEKISPNSKIVAIHDAVRPLIAHSVIQSLLSSVEHYPAVIPVIPVFESIRKITGENSSEIVNRNEYVLVQLVIV